MVSRSLQHFYSYIHCQKLFIKLDPDAEISDDDGNEDKYVDELREYDRAAHLVRNATSPVPRFLHLYATYMAMEKRRLDSTTDQSNLYDSGHFKDPGEILVTLRAEHSRNKLESYGMYLYGVMIEEQKRPRKILTFSYWKYRGILHAEQNCSP
ncbi:hypothetical protein GQX74_013624 [Glossina fuscipes]|nr:hypothetical protein GQX74_013624 [Glossina fuscipes]